MTSAGKNHIFFRLEASNTFFFRDGHHSYWSKTEYDRIVREIEGADIDAHVVDEFGNHNQYYCMNVLWDVLILLQRMTWE